MINLKLNNLLHKIFENYNLNNISQHEKRKIVFNYLANNITYDEELLSKIKNKTAKRNPFNELLDVLDNNKGICNSISQVYMLLLEKLGIESICVCCDDSTDVYHQLNLVKESDTFVFDDITYAIFNKDKLSRFNCDIEKINNLGLGLNKIYDTDYWVIIPPSYVYAILDKDHIDNINDFEEFINNINTTKRI